jgi:hypothetical protein
MQKRTATRIVGVSIIVAGIVAYLASALAENASTVLVQCIDYPAGSSAPSGCRTVVDNTIYLLKPIMNEDFRQASILLSIAGAAVFVVTEIGFRHKLEAKGTAPEH